MTDGQRRTEYRIRGERADGSVWDGTWHRFKPSLWDVEQYRKRHPKVWAERREVWETEPERVNDADLR